MNEGSCITQAEMRVAKTKSWFDCQEISVNHTGVFEIMAMNFFFWFLIICQKHANKKTEKHTQNRVKVLVHIKQNWIFDTRKQREDAKKKYQVKFVRRVFIV